MTDTINTPTRRLVQIAVIPHPQHDTDLIGLCNDGTLWRGDGDFWSLLSDVPQGSVTELREAEQEVLEQRFEFVNGCVGRRGGE